MADSRFEVFRGYICQDFSAEESKDDEQENDEKEIDWDDQELDAITAGALHVQPRKPPYRKVLIRSLENGKTVQAHGNFLSADPWWEVTVTLRPKVSSGTLYRGKNVIRAMRCQPSYRLRRDAKLDEGGDYGSVIVQFLTECKVEVPSKDPFMRYVRTKVPPGGHVSFKILFGVFEDCELIEDEKNRGLLCMVKPYIMNSECGILARQAMENPTLFKFIPILLPDRMVALMKQCADADTYKLKKLEATLQEKPWAFGFSTALRKETNIVLTEVSADRFKQAGLLESMEQHIQDALHCYYVLKQKCWKEGHTYLWEKGLRIQLSKTYPGYRVKDWEKMCVFLENREVHAIHRTAKGRWTKIFLYRYWNAENKIVKSLKAILEREGNDLSCLKEDLDDEDELFEKEVNDDIKDACSENLQQEEGSLQDNQNTDADIPGSISKGEHLPSNDNMNLSELLKGIGADNATSRDNSFDISFENVGCLFPEEISNNVEPQPDTRTQAETDLINFKDDTSQHAAARSIRENPFTIISGKGGCGKTHVVCLVLAEYPSYAVTMAAPTGKAASNLRKRNKGNIEAFTLHQISFQYTLYIRKKAQYDKEKHVDNELKEPEFKFKSTEILVVDECSMVPITIFSNVLHALLYQGKLKKLVLLGDYRQLPSVEPGNLLSDLYKVFKQYGWSIELTKNHRAESQLIVDNATRISEKTMPHFDRDMGFQMIELPENNGFADVNFLRGVVQKLYESDESIQDHKRSQFVAFRRADCNLINDWCCPLYAGHPTVDTKNQYVFQYGDKICPTRNANVPDLSAPENNKSISGNASLQQNSSATQKVCSVEDMPGPSNRALSQEQLTEEAAEIAFLEQLCTQNPVSPSPGHQGQMDGSFSGEDNKEKGQEKRICNGEIYFIQNMHEIQEPGKKKKDENVTMTDGETELCVPLRDLKLKAAIKHAWARTIHTYQGSESETVIYLLGNSGAQNWQHVYTAITRGKSQVYIIGTKSQLHKAINRDFNQRNTEMKEMLMDQIVPKLKKAHEQNVKNQALVACMSSQTQNKGVLAGQRTVPASQLTQKKISGCTFAKDPKQLSNVPPVRNLICMSSQALSHKASHKTKLSLQYSQQTRSSYATGTEQKNKTSPSRNCYQHHQNELPLDTWSKHPTGKEFRASNHQWRQKKICSPVKAFTSIKDITDKTITSSNEGLTHSTPKPTKTFSSLSSHDKEDDADYDDWSNEWSEEHLRQVIDMETSALADKSDNTSQPLFEDETVTEEPLACCQNTISRPKPVFETFGTIHTNTSRVNINQVENKVECRGTTSSYNLSVQPPCNSETLLCTNDANTDDESMQRNGYQSPPPSRKIVPKLQMSPFSPNTSARFSQALSLSSPPKSRAKRLYTDMKDSPITDGFPYKKLIFFKD